MQRGISLLELMLSLAIIAIILVLATRYFLNTRTSQQVNEAAEMITSVYSAGESWMQSAPLNQEMMVEFLKNGSVPKDFANPNANPWGGDIKAFKASSDSTSQLEISLSNVPMDACQNLAAKIKQKMNPLSVGNCGEESVFTVVFDLSS